MHVYTPFEDLAAAAHLTPSQYTPQTAPMAWAAQLLLLTLFDNIKSH